MAAFLPLPVETAPRSTVKAQGGHVDTFVRCKFRDDDDTREIEREKQRGSRSCYLQTLMESQVHSASKTFSKINSRQSFQHLSPRDVLRVLRSYAWLHRVHYLDIFPERQQRLHVRWPRAICELTGIFPRIDRISPSSTSNRYSKGYCNFLILEIDGLRHK